MINVWMKCRNRGQHKLQEVLKNLNFWIKLFSNKNKYNIYLYNEDLELPAYFKKFKHINYIDKKMLMNEYECKYICSAIDRSVISHWWKRTAQALSFPYFYFKEDQYIIQIDADDLYLEGNALYYIEKTLDYMINNKLDIISYDMLFSYNGRYAEKRSHWTFGLNISKLMNMKSIIMLKLNTPIKEQKDIGISLDLVIDYHLNSSKQEYICFITPGKLNHMDHGYTKYVGENLVEIDDYGTIIKVPKATKTLVIQ